jgi:hypothetical protein
MSGALKLIKAESRLQGLHHFFFGSSSLSLPRMLSGANTFEISDFQEVEIEAG